MTLLTERVKRTTHHMESNGKFCTLELDATDGVTVIKEVRHLLIGDNTLIQDYSQQQFVTEVIEPITQLTYSGYGLDSYIPPFHYEWGANQQGKQRGFIVMSKVDGEDIVNVSCIPSEFVPDLDRLISKSLHIAHASKSDGKYIQPDIFTSDHDGVWSLHNIVIGTLNGNDHKRPYIVDLYPARWKVKPQFLGNKPPLEDLIDRLSRQSGYSFSQSRVAMRKSA